MKRRDVVSSVGVSVLGAATLGTATTVSAQDSSDVSITFDDQATDGTRLTVAEVRTDVEAQFRILDSESTTLAGPISLDAGTATEDYEVDLQPPLTETETVTANLYNSDGQGIAREAARITVNGAQNFVSGMEPTLVEPDSDAGFNYPYFLYAPARRDSEQAASILVQPNNSGQTTDDFDVQQRSARRRIEGGTSRMVADRLSVPLLIPVFPRPESAPVDWRHYVHALDRQTMQISDGPVERVDRQLLRMADDARQRLNDQSYSVDDQLMLNGFSAAGNFVDRFTILHPDRVRSVTAGGLNGTAILPVEEADGHTLDFHIGIADVEALTGEPVDLDALSDTNQLLYMGEDDGNDTIPYDDAWSDEMREIALDVYGEAMVTDRFPTCQRAYEQAGVDAQFKVYEGAGHSPHVALEDIVEFHQRSLDGEDVSGFGQQLGLRPAFEYTPDQPTTGAEATFDASSTALGVGEVLAYTWELAGDETAAGETITHQFNEPGEHAVTLRAIDNKGRVETTTTTVRVGEPTTDGSQESDSTSPGGQEPDNRSSGDAEPSGESTDGTTPGFGIGAAVTSLVGAAYAQARLRGDDQ